MKSVRVAVIYEPSRRMKPIWFDLDGNQIKITEVCYYWKSALGAAELHNFSVMTEADGLYELTFNALNQTWTAVQKGH